MRLLKDKTKILKILMVAFLSLGVLGCKQYVYDTKYQIEDNAIFNQSEEEYLVYFYKDNCPYCEKSFETIEKYLLSDVEIKLYVCDITNSSIAKIYEGDNGQGTEGKYFVDGAQDYNELYIAGAPSIIKIKNNESMFIASGRKNVIAYIEQLLQENKTT